MAKLWKKMPHPLLNSKQKHLMRLKVNLDSKRGPKLKQEKRGKTMEKSL